MNLSSSDIKKSDFKKVLRGYDPNEIEAFLETVSSHYEKLVIENKNLSDKIKSLQTDLDIYKENEMNLQKAIVKSQELGAEALQNAKKKAEMIIKEGELNARKFRQDVEEEIINKKQELDEIKLKNDKLIGDVKNFLNDKLNELEEFVKHQKVLKMGLTSLSESLEEEKEERDEDFEDESTDEEPKQDMKKVSISSFDKDVKDKPFDDNFEVK
ncbi:MAG: DivIVA domain-containing protein [Ignavibacteria bacterium]|nr:DivIVA domain-containing protein [Ignavibacteria bacterium]